MTTKYIGNTPILVNDDLTPYIPIHIRKYNKKLYIAIGLILIIFLLTIAKTDGSTTFKYSNIWHQTDVQLNDSSILAELIILNSPCPSIALKQVKLESANYTSVICKENKNIAGIKYNSHGYTIGENKHHAVYKTYKDCLKDLVRIQNMYLKSLEKCGYAEDIDYTKKLYD